MKLFKPRAPKPFRPEEDATYHISFPFDVTKQPTALPELAAAVSRVRTEISSLRAIVDSGNGRRTVGVIMEDLSRTKDLMEIHRVAREKAQAQGRAGLIAEKEILPALHLEEKTRDAWRALQTELAAAVAANEAAVSLASLLAELS
ncbi:hypothetical protein PQR52_10235 [Paraburkholderia aspalathi]|uniref:hypothetical protein n=1 Tax=Paraburkholderia aspalathi TaxID=1324617 RepID=UPI0038BDD281